jgi:hypothetical protein
MGREGVRGLAAMEEIVSIHACHRDCDSPLMHVGICLVVWYDRCLFFLALPLVCGHESLPNDLVFEKDIFFKACA